MNLPSAQCLGKANARTVRKSVAVCAHAMLWSLAGIMALGLARAEGSARHAPEPAGLDNLVAFARVLGYVRYFHPSDESATADWDAVAIQGVRAVEGARGPDDLADRLNAIFRPLAPTVRIFPKDKAPEMNKVEAPASATRLLIWRHLGMPQVAMKDSNCSARIDLRKQSPFLTEPKTKVPVPDANHPFVADLGAGVTIRLPLAVYANAEGTLPRGGKAEKLPPDSHPDGKNRAGRLAVVILAWNLMQHFYPYFDVIDTDWSAALRDALTRAQTDDSELAFLATLRRLVAGLQDAHGYVLLQSSPVLSFPPVRWTWIEDQATIVAAAAPEAGDLRPGDRILKIDGVAAHEASARIAPEICAANADYRKRAALGTLMFGSKDSEIQLEIERGNSALRQVTLRRALNLDRFRTLSNEPRPEPISELRKGVWYLDVDRATQKTYTEALPRLAQAEAVILDFRGYPRLGLNAPMENLIDDKITGPPVLIPLYLYPDRQHVAFHPGRNMEIAPAKPRLRGRIVFLTDYRAVSAAENFLMMVQHYGLGTVIGSGTAGTNGNVRVATLPGGYEFRFTVLRVLNYDGSPFHGKGVQPTIAVSRTLPGVLAGRDEILEAALKFLDKK